MSYSIVAPISMKEELNLNLKTWQLFLFILLAHLALSWFYNEQILTREVYHNLFSENMETTRIDEYFDMTREFTLWGYALQPLLLLIKIGFLALLIQLPLLILFIEIPFKQIFRIATYSSVAMLLFAAIQMLWLFFLESSDITQMSLQMEPFSVANLFATPESPNLPYMLLGRFNIFELAWCVIFYKGLVATGKIKNDTAGLLIFGIWTALLLFQAGIFAYFSGVNA